MVHGFFLFRYNHDMSERESFHPEAYETQPDDWSVAAEKIAACADADQYMRKNYETAWDPELDKKNTEVLRAIVDKQGWPTLSRVGEKVSNDAWLLAQHADHDVAFQQECLQRMKESRDDIDPTNIPYLEDRVLINQKLPQRYGTQWRIIKGEHVLFPIEDEEHLAERRKAAGLEPIEAYTAFMKSKDLPPTKES